MIPTQPSPGDVPGGRSNNIGSIAAEIKVGACPSSTALYIDEQGKANITGRLRETFTSSGGGTFSMNVKQDIDLVLVGLNYRLGRAPVVARY